MSRLSASRSMTIHECTPSRSSREIAFSAACKKRDVSLSANGRERLRFVLSAVVIFSVGGRFQ
jgi:hypothetical protein